MLLCYSLGELEEDRGNLPLLLLACVDQVEMGIWPSSRKDGCKYITTEAMCYKHYAWCR